MPYQIAALLAATCWSLSSLILAEPVRRLGGPRFCRLRMLYVSFALLIISIFRNQWETIEIGDFWLITLSAIVGLVVGDIGLFTAMARIGPRRTSVLFTTNAPMAAVGGVLLFDEVLRSWALLGAVLTVLGVMLAVNYGTNQDVKDSVFEKVDGSLKVGAFWASLGAFGQAIGALAAKPVLDHGADTLTVATLRVLIATPLMWLLANPTDKLASAPEKEPVANMDWLKLVASGTLAMVLGMSFLLYAIGNGDTGIASILGGTTPVIMLPLLWIATRRAPALGAWAGAILSIFGIALMM